jgi:predicted membrane protein (TIGR00267 family)
MVLIDNRYLVLGFLDSVLTTLVLGDSMPNDARLVFIVTIINLITAFMAEYVEERNSLRHIERQLLMRRGSLLRTSLHRRAIYDALIKGLMFGAVSLVGSTITVLSMGIKVLWIPIIPIVALGSFGTLMSKYFGGNAAFWFILYVILGVIASFTGHVISRL